MSLELNIISYTDILKLELFKQKTLEINNIKVEERKPQIIIPKPPCAVINTNIKQNQEQPLPIPKREIILSSFSNTMNIPSQKPRKSLTQSEKELILKRQHNEEAFTGIKLDSPFIQYEFDHFDGNRHHKDNELENFKALSVNLHRIKTLHPKLFNEISQNPKMYLLKSALHFLDSRELTKSLNKEELKKLKQIENLLHDLLEK